MSGPAAPGGGHAAETVDVLPLHHPDAEPRWTALHTASPHREPCTAFVVLAAAADALGLDGRVHLVRRAGRDAAGALLLSRRRGPFREVVVPPFTPYSAVAAAASVAEADVHARRSDVELLLADVEARYDRARLHLPPSWTDVRPWTWRGWTAAPLYTYRLRVAPLAEAMVAWSSSTRRLYRREADAYTLTPADAEAVAALAAGSYDRQDRAFPADAERLTRWARRLEAAGAARSYLLLDGDGVPAAGWTLLHDDRTAYYWLVGSRPGPAMTVLLGRMLDALAPEGLETLDLVGANTPSIAEFKRRFGPSLVPYVGATYVRHPALRLWQALRMLPRPSR